MAPPMIVERHNHSFFKFLCNSLGSIVQGEASILKLDEKPLLSTLHTSIPANPKETIIPDRTMISIIFMIPRIVDLK